MMTAPLDGTGAPCAHAQRHTRPTITKAEFEAVRVEQAERHKGKAGGLSNFDRAIGGVAYEAATLAMADVAQGRTARGFRVCSCPTGSGKTTSAAAFIATGWRKSEAFSAAYVVPTIALADEFGAMIGDLIGRENVCVWTTAHNAGASKEARERLDEEYGPLRMALRLRSELPVARVVVCTHKLWLSEMDKNVDHGVRRYRGQWRDVVFVDEHPDLVTVRERTPGDIHKMLDRVRRVDPEHPYAMLLREIVDRCEEAFTSAGSAYAPLDLVTPEEVQAIWRTDRVPSMRPFLDHGLSVEDASAQAHEMEETVRFIVAAAKGCVFLVRGMGAAGQRRAIVAYDFAFTPGPGHVLLDATADITGLVTLMEGSELLDVPTVDYSALSVHHLEHPTQFRTIREVVRRAKLARPYAQWIKRTVVRNSDPGERVLVVVHKAMLTLEFLPDAPDPEEPAEWEGRQVNTITWGMGIGSNRYSDAEAVFLFGEFFVPRSKTIADVAGWSGRNPTEDDLNKAGARALKGTYQTAFNGHLLRWAKQLASRGRVRNIDPEGRCSPMRLYTSMDLGRLLTSLGDLFPGAAAPILVRPNRGKKSRGSGLGPKRPAAQKLQELLLDADTPYVLWSIDVERQTGIRGRDLARTIAKSEALKATLEIAGWQLVSAKEIGEAGKEKALVRVEAAFPTAG